MNALQTEETLHNGQRLVVHTPAGARGALVWFHGGGWRIPLGDDSIRWGRDLAAATRLRVLLPDYPLAPERRCAEINAWCAAFWLHAARNGAAYLGGDSAGAQLALCALPAAQPEKMAFVYAVTTLLPDRASNSYARFRRGWPLSPRLLDCFMDAYCPDAAQRRAASPLEQPPGALPPACLLTAGDDILADQQTAFARRFGATQILYEGARHVFLSRPDGAAFRQRALDDLARWFAD